MKTESINIYIDSTTVPPTFNERMTFGIDGIIKAVAFYLDGSVPTVPISIQLDKENGDTVIDALPYQAYKDKEAGDFYSSKLPLNISTQNLRVKAFGTKGLAADFEGTLIFFIEPKS